MPFWPIYAKFGEEMQKLMKTQVTSPKQQLFENPRWQTAAVLKIVLSPYLSRETSDFDQIW